MSRIISAFNCATKNELVENKRGKPIAYSDRKDTTPQPGRTSQDKREQQLLRLTTNVAGAYSALFVKKCRALEISSSASI